jgi:hypothetical protein
MKGLGAVYKQEKKIAKEQKIYHSFLTSALQNMGLAVMYS